jgi:hypothetical protein
MIRNSTARSSRTTLRELSDDDAFSRQQKKSGVASISPVPRGILGLDRAVALSLGAALFTSVLSVAAVISDPSIAARLSGWWSGSEPTARQQAWQEDFSAGGPMPLMEALKHVAPAGTNIQVSDVVTQAAAARQFSWNGGTRLAALNSIMRAASDQGRVLPGGLLVTPAPFAYRIEEGVSILRQLAVWSRHEGWELDWQALEAPPSATQRPGVPMKTPVDWPSPRTIDFGQDFDRAFASVINGMNAERRRQGKRPLSATANFTAGRIIVGFSDEAEKQSREARNGRGDSEKAAH